MRELFLEEDEIALVLNLLPKEEVPKGLDPTFYHTLLYGGDVELQKTADGLREKLQPTVCSMQD